MANSGKEIALPGVVGSYEKGESTEFYLRLLVSSEILERELRKHLLSPTSWLGQMAVRQLCNVVEAPDNRNPKTVGRSPPRPSTIPNHLLQRPAPRPVRPLVRFPTRNIRLNHIIGGMDKQGAKNGPKYHFFTPGHLDAPFSYSAGCNLPTIWHHPPSSEPVFCYGYSTLELEVHLYLEDRLGRELENVYPCFFLQLPDGPLLFFS